jgi:hypothetical protein
VKTRALAALVVLFLLGGCGGAAEGDGTAQLWVTRDRGANLIVETEVEAGQSLMRALDGEVDLETRYGGRFVQSINGIAGSLESQHDWFWFVNGYEGDRSASAYRLRDGDVAWLDYRAWEREGEARIVVGAFPEPFLHGYGGRVRPTDVRYEPGAEGQARELAKIVDAETVAPLGAEYTLEGNVLEVRVGPPRAAAELLGESAGDPVRFVVSGEPRLTRRYKVP